MRSYLYDDAFRLCYVVQLTWVWWRRNLECIRGKMQLRERFTFRLNHFVFHFL